MLVYSLSLSLVLFFFFFFSSRRRHTRFDCDWSSDVCSSDLRCQVRLLRGEGCAFYDWILAPCPSVQNATACLRRATTNLFEEERNSKTQAGVSQLPDPLQVKGSVMNPAFPARDHPVDATEVDPKRTNQRLTGKEAHGRGHLPEVVGAVRDA